MKLVSKEYVSSDAINGNGAASGAWIFKKLDEAGVIFMDETFIHDLKPLFIVTNYSDVKFKHEVFCYGYIEIYAECVNITPARIDVRMELYHRVPKIINSVTNKKVLATTATFSYTLLDMETRKIFKIPKDIIKKHKDLERGQDGNAADC